MLILLWIATLASARVYVFSPDSLRAEFEGRYHHGVIPASLANFGNPAYGTVMVGRAFLPVAGQELGCGSLTRISFTDDPDSVNTPILILERGECPFVYKVRQAQDIGASAVVIIDNKVEDVEKVIMTDNGSGGNIFIPSFIISKTDGELIKNAIKNSRTGKHVALTLVFDMKQDEGKVNYSLWYSSENKKVYSFLKEFKSYAMRFSKDQTAFTPNMVLWYCAMCREKGYKESHQDCISGGRYCAPDPDGTGPYNGRDVMLEDLRQLCVFKQTENEESYETYFKYMIEYSKTCEDNLTKECSHKVLDAIDLSSKEIEKCVDNSVEGRNIDLDENTLFKYERDRWQDYGVAFYPSLMINNQTYRGDLEAQPVFQALCAGFVEPQEECRWDYGQDDEESEDTDEDGIGTGSLLLILSLCFAMMAVVLIVYRMWLKKEMKNDMRNQVNTAVSQYFALSEQSGINMAERNSVKVNFA